ncbi:unnamed protein product [Brassica rapa]|uniref:Uncharacterized protein n=1 Tax=Brassica campestris TaxID=3711 RepID=A0A8D9LVJ9_BRACM|nr:unnamed protein product [Brassica rapa]
MERHISPLIVSDMIHIRDEVSSTQDFLIAGNSKIFDFNTFVLQIEIQRSSLIVSSVIKLQDAVSSTQDLLIPQSSNILELNSHSKKTMNDVEHVCGDMHIKYLTFLR